MVLTWPHEKREILDVHKSHIILGKVGADVALKELKEIVSKGKYLDFLDSNTRNKYKYVYKDNKDDCNKNEFKKIINYFSNFKINRKFSKNLQKNLIIN